VTITQEKKLFHFQRIAFLFTFFSSFFFFLLTTLAMVFYPGGTEEDPSKTHYLFFSNFFSDLGRTTVFDGATNFISRTLFIIALSFISLSLLALFFAIVPFFKANKTERALSALGTLGGTVSALGYFFLAIIPVDKKPIAHGTFTFIAFIATFFALLFYAIAILKAKYYPKSMAWIIIPTILISLGYLIILFNGGSEGMLANLTLQAISQKIIVYCQILAFLLFSLISYRFLLQRKETATAIIEEK